MSTESDNSCLYTMQIKRYFKRDTYQDNCIENWSAYNRGYCQIGYVNCMLIFCNLALLLDWAGNFTSLLNIPVIIELILFSENDKHMHLLCSAENWFLIDN